MKNKNKEVTSHNESKISGPVKLLVISHQKSGSQTHVLTGDAYISYIPHPCTIWKNVCVFIKLWLSHISVLKKIKCYVSEFNMFMNLILSNGALSLLIKPWFICIACTVASWHFPNKKPELDHNWPTKPACLIEMNGDFSRLWVQIQFLAVLVVYLLPNVLTVRHKITAELLTFKHILLTGILSVRPHCKNTKFYLYSSD